jgi:hypothetical protein
MRDVYKDEASRPQHAHSDCALDLSNVSSRCTRCGLEGRAPSSEVAL